MEHNPVSVKKVRVTALCCVCGEAIEIGDNTVWQRVDDSIWNVWHQSCNVDTPSEEVSNG